MVWALNLIVGNHGWPTLLGFSGEWPQVFFKPTDAIRVAVSPRIGVGPGFDSQGTVNFFTKYCFPNLHRIHVKAFEVEDCEFVPVHHQPKVLYSAVEMKILQYVTDLWSMNINE